MSTMTYWLNDAEVEVDFTYYRGAPARLWGDPDNWAPEEPEEIEIHSVSYTAKDETTKQSVTVDIAAMLSYEQLEAIEIAICEAADERKAA